MPYTVRPPPRAEFDAQQIYNWIKEQSPVGAVRWWQAFLDACERLKQQPMAYALAPEAEVIDRDIRKILFRTRRGKCYRAFFTVAEDEVQIVRVRGPGQASLKPDELC